VQSLRIEVIIRSEAEQKIQHHLTGKQRRV